MILTFHNLRCSFFGHRYATIIVHNLEKHKKEYWYQCVRCGHRSRFSNLRDTILNKVLVEEIKL